MLPALRALRGAGLRGRQFGGSFCATDRLLALRLPCFARTLGRLAFLRDYAHLVPVRSATFGRGLYCRGIFLGVCRVVRPRAIPRCRLISLNFFVFGLIFQLCCVPLSRVTYLNLGSLRALNQAPRDQYEVRRPLGHPAHKI